MFFAIPSNEINNLLNNIPINTGIVTIKNIFNAISIREMPWLAKLVPSKDKEIPKIKGIVITLKILIAAVKEIDKATSPFANEVRIFEVAPPGAAASIITPIAISGDKGQTYTSSKATIGKMISWEKKPIRNSFGFKNILVKSFIESPRPNENIIKAKVIGKITSVTIFTILNYHLIL